MNNDPPKKLKLKQVNIIKRGMLVFIAVKMLGTKRSDEVTEMFRFLDKDIDGYLSLSDIQVKKDL